MQLIFKSQTNDDYSRNSEQMMIIWAFKPSIARIFLYLFKRHAIASIPRYELNWLCNCITQWCHRIVKEKNREKETHSHTERNRYSMHWIMCSWWAVNHFEWMISSHIQKKTTKVTIQAPWKCACVCWWVEKGFYTMDCSIWFRFCVDYGFG